MNISEIESTFSRELAAYMEEKYGIDIDEVICEAILEVEDAKLHQILKALCEQINKRKM